MPDSAHEGPGDVEPGPATGQPGGEARDGAWQPAYHGVPQELGERQHRNGQPPPDNATDATGGSATTGTAPLTPAMFGAPSSDHAAYAITGDQGTYPITGDQAAGFAPPTRPGRWARVARAAATLLGMTVLLGAASLVGMGLGVWHPISAPSARSSAQSQPRFSSESLVPPGPPKAGPSRPVGPGVPNPIPAPGAGTRGSTPRPGSGSTESGPGSGSRSGSDRESPGAAAGSERHTVGPGEALGHPVSAAGVGAHPVRGGGPAADLRPGPPRAAAPATTTRDHSGDDRSDHGDHSDHSDHSDHRDHRDYEGSDHASDDDPPSDEERDDTRSHRAHHEIDHTAAPDLLGLLDGLTLG